MHGYCSNCAFMHNFTPTNVGVFFWSKCVKWRVFCILQDFASTNVDVLTVHICTVTVTLTFKILLFFPLSTSRSLFLSPSDYLSSLIWSLSSSTLFYILFSLKSNNKSSNSSNVNQSRSQIHQALSSIYIYIYISQSHINNQTQIAKEEEEENAKIVEEQGVEELAAVNGEPQNHHPCSGKIYPKSLPKLQIQNH